MKIIRRIASLFHRVHHLHNALADYPYAARRAAYERLIFDDDAPMGISDRDYCGHPVVVSLTSYGRRMLDVCFAIESIMQQSWRPNRIVLWLAEKDMADLPEALLRQQKRGLEIKATSDMGSYKKLLPALAEMPQAVLITIDDDMIYDFDLVERLVKRHKAQPDAIVATWSNRATLDSRGNLRPYNKWDKTNDSPETADNATFFIGGGGVLYPPGSLHSDALADAHLIERLCPTADDIWFNIHARRQGTAITKIHTRHPEGKDFVSNENMYPGSLVQVNEVKGNNDICMRRTLEHYDLKPSQIF